MFDREKLPPELEELSKAIVKAIRDSEEVKRALGNLDRKKILHSKSFLAFVLSMQSLGEPGDPPKETSKGKRRRGRKSEALAQYIDGKRLSPNEVAFQEYCIQLFNEHAWLRGLGLKFDAKDKN